MSSLIWYTPFSMFELAQKIISLATQKKLRICSVESVTGGRVASSLTSIPNSSATFYSGIVTYSLDSKLKFLEIPRDFFEHQSVYSTECALLMAEAWRKKCEADICISTTGEAMNSRQIFFGLSDTSETQTFVKILSGNRNQVQEEATEHALELILEACRKSNTT